VPDLATGWGMPARLRLLVRLITLPYGGGAIAG